MDESGSAVTSPTANRRAWIAKGGKALVADGHPTASILLARVGQRIDAKNLAVFANAAEFFDGIDPSEKRESAEKKTTKKE